MPRSMSHLSSIIEQRLRHAVAAAFGPEAADADPMLRPGNQPHLGDYQANLAMSLGKQLGRPPREVAQAIAQQLTPAELFSQVDVAGPGFLNLTLRPEVIGDHASAMANDEGLGISPATPAQTVVVDYSSPNVAKEMHVGHLRSTVIGDSIARTLEALGHAVVRQNHLGDWGTQFGMLITHLLDQGFDPAAGASPGELTQLYKAAKARFDADPDFAERARQRVVELQAGDPTTRAIWRALVDSSQAYFDRLYDQLGIGLRPSDSRGESFYNDRLEPMMDRLQREGHLQISQGAGRGFSGRIHRSRRSTDADDRA